MRRTRKGKTRMKVSAEAGLNAALRQLPDGPPESGGILGGRDQTVTDIVLDKGRIGGRPCSYTPDVAFLNREIKRWAEKGLRFMGVFHVHFGGAEALSEGDRNYIARIMDAMPEGYDRLYFPVVVMPERRVVAYQAMRTNEKIEIKRDEIEYQGGN